MLAQLPTPPLGAIESWLLSAAAVCSMIVLPKNRSARRPPIEAESVSKVESRMSRDNVEHELDGLRDKIDPRFLSLGEKIEEMKSELLTAGERRGSSLHRRINE